MKKTFLMITIALLMATTAGCSAAPSAASSSSTASSSSSASPSKEKNTQTEDVKTTDNQTTTTTDTSTQSSVESNFDVDKLLKATYPNDPNYAYKEKVTKDFVSKGESIRKILGDTYVDSNRDGNDKTFSKSSIGDSLRYSLAPKNYDYSSKDTKLTYTYQLSIFDSLKTSSSNLSISMRISATEQTVKLDDKTQKILGLYSNSINFDDANKTMQECMTGAKNKANSVFMSPNKINIDSSTKISFSSIYSDTSQMVTIYIYIDQKGGYY